MAVEPDRGGGPAAVGPVAVAADDARQPHQPGDDQHDGQRDEDVQQHSLGGADVSALVGPFARRERVVSEGGACAEQDPPDGGGDGTVSLRLVTPGFFDTIGIRLLQGRDISPADSSTSPFVAVVSESFARQHWQGENAVGRQFFVAFFNRTVVGVVSDIKVRGLERISEPQVYVPSPWLRTRSPLQGRSVPASRSTW